ncbi:helix-turn-helix domain-containing protein [Labrys neptuniae]
MTEFLKVNFKNIISAIKQRSYVTSYDIAGVPKDLLKSKFHGYNRINDNAFLHILDFEALKSYNIQNVREDVICIQIMLTGSYSRTTGAQVELVNSATTQISNFPLSSIDIHRGQTLRGIFIAIEREYFVSSFGLKINRIPKIFKPIFESPIGMPQALRLPTLINVYDCASQIIACKMHDVVRDIYIQSKSIEILCYIVNQLNGMNASTSALRIPRERRNAQLVEAAAAIYHRELHSQPSIEQLSSRIGLNRNELTAGFRDRFGVTPRAYGLGVRMARAQLLLDSGEITVSEVARRVGYEGYASFSRAYRRYFGTNPMRRRS